MLNIRHYRIFQCVAQCLNMSHAAKQLYISQPTVSQTIAEMENYYGIKLFERYPKKLFLTDAGKRLLKTVNAFLYSYEEINNMNLKDTKTILHIGATHTIEDSILDHILSDAQQHSDLLDFYVRVTNTATIEKMILSNEVDFGIIEGKIENDDIITMPITEDTLLLICSINHPFATKKTVTLEDLHNVNFVLREKGSGTRELFERKMAFHHINYKVKWECTGFNAVKNAVINNRGIGVISSRMIQKELKNNLIKIVPLKEFIWKRNFFLVYHKNKEISDNILPFYDATINFNDFN